MFLDVYLEGDLSNAVSTIMISPSWWGNTGGLLPLVLMRQCLVSFCFRFCVVLPQGQIGSVPVPGGSFREVGALSILITGMANYLTNEIESSCCLRSFGFYADVWFLVALSWSRQSTI